MFPLFFIFFILSTFSRTFFYHFSAPSCLFIFVISLFLSAFCNTYFCACVLYVLSVYACMCKYTCLCTDTETREDVCPFCCTVYSFETGSLSESGAHIFLHLLEASKLQQSSHLLPSQTWVASGIKMPGFYVSTEIQTPVLMITQLVYLTTEPPLQHVFCFLTKKILFLCFYVLC